MRRHAVAARWVMYRKPIERWGVARGRLIHYGTTKRQLLWVLVDMPRNEGNCECSVYSFCATRIYRFGTEGSAHIRSDSLARSLGGGSHL